jgi:cytochrome P450
MFRLASQVLFDYDVTPQDAAVISRAYGDFAAYVLRNNVLRGLPDEGRERVSFATLSRKETPPLSSDTVRDMALRRIFSSMNSSVNEALPVMHQYSNDVYEYGKASEGDHIVHEYEKAGLSREQILAEIFIMQAGFHSSTASILSSGLGVLGTPAMHQYQDRLRESLRGGRADELHRALLEVGRLYPPFWVLTRTVLRDFELDGKKVPAGKQMGFVVYAANRSTKVFGDDAADFRPDRFIKDPQLRGKLGLFGFGRRRCPSGDLGMRSASQFMTEFLSRQQVRSAHTNVPMEFEATLRPRKLALDFEAAA